MHDIFVNAIGSFIGGLALLWLAMSKHGISLLQSKLERPSLRLKLIKTPKNIFTGIQLGAPARWVEQQLGAPSKEGERWWGYRFSDSLVSISFDANNAVNTIAVALVNHKTTFEFPALHFDCPPLGKLSLEDLQNVEHLAWNHQESMRHSEILVTGREGPSGVWHYIAFGALSPVIPGPLVPVQFQWNLENKTLISRPKDIRINWASISSTSKIEGFPWDFGINN